MTPPVSDAPVSVMKSAGGVSLYSRFVNRPVGRVLATVLCRLGVSANTITAVSAVLGAVALSVLCLRPPSATVGIIVALLLVLVFALDSADGQVARMTGTSSLSGEWFDHVVDAGKHVALHSAVLVGWFRFDVQEGAWLALPLVFQLVTVVLFSALHTATLLKRQQPTRPAPSSGGGSLTRGVFLLPADHGVLCWSFVLYGATTAFRWVYLVLFLLNAVILAGFLRKWFRELVEGESVHDTQSELRG